MKVNLDSKSIKLSQILYCIICPCGTLFDFKVPHTCHRMKMEEGRLQLAFWNKDGEAFKSVFRINPNIKVSKPFGAMYEPDRQAVVIPAGCRKAN